MVEETGQAEIVETLRCRIQHSVLQATVVLTAYIMYHVRVNVDISWIHY